MPQQGDFKPEWDSPATEERKKQEGEHETLVDWVREKLAGRRKGGKLKVKQESDNG